MIEHYCLIARMSAHIILEDHQAIEKTIQQLINQRHPEELIQHF